APLVDGLADRLRADGRTVFGPGADGARLEGSKAWMKDLVHAAGVPTARHGTFTDVESAWAMLDTLPPPFVVKTDGLAAGKGVLVTDSLAEARNAVGDYLSGASFGDAGRRLVIEEGLVGPELSVLAVCDGTEAVLLPPAQDFKRIGDGDVGPNTGGMGAYSPVPIVDDEVLATVMDRFIAPTLAELRRRRIDYRGVLYAGLMFTAEGPKLIEYNVRFGDPETQVVVPRLTSDLAQLLVEAAEGHISTRPTVSADAHVTVVCASEGYPGAPRTGDLIEGLDVVAAMPDVQVYAAGVGRDEAGRLTTAGGRVLDVCGRGATISEARARAYAAVDAIGWRGMQVRHDVAASAATS
ncbi:MAG: phosphoribosylamine--glycine ligase, partial [Actinobacteria bacterium]|nr:phosphoribosylamine--glycine ligase [Actinomycetota bacterium]